MQVKALVSGEIIIKGLPEPVFHELREALSFVNPYYVAAKRFSTSGNVDHIPKRIYCVKPDRLGYAHAPRGAVNIIRNILDEHNISIQIIDGRTTGKPIKCKAALGLREYQRSAQQSAIKRVQGVIVLPCGGGKTFIGVSIIGKMKRTALVVVHTKDLRDQWLESLKKIGIKAGQIGDGIVDIQDVTVAIVDSIENVLKNKNNIKLFTRFGIVIVDESHHVPANTFQKILPHLPAKWRFGLTATPDREDGLTNLMYWSLGTQLFNYPTDKLIEDGFLMHASVVPIETDFTFSQLFGDSASSTEYVHKMTSALITDEWRNNIIVELAKREANKGESVLVLSNRVEHCDFLAEEISNRGINCTSLTGRTKKKFRKPILDNFREGKIQCITATSLADEGLDVPNLSRLVLALPSKAKGRTTQRAGRVMRPGKNSAIIYDIIDVRVPTLLARWMQRKRIFSSIGLDIREPRKFII